MKFPAPFTPIGNYAPNHPKTHDEPTELEQNTAMPSGNEPTISAIEPKAAAIEPTISDIEPTRIATTPGRSAPHCDTITGGEL